EIVVRKIAAECKAKPGDLRGGISTQNVAGNIAKNGQTPLVTVSVQTTKRRLAACAANGLAKEVIARVSPFANQKINNFSAQVTNDQKQITQFNAALGSSSLSVSDKLLLQGRLAQA